MKTNLVKKGNSDNSIKSESLTYIPEVWCLGVALSNQIKKHAK